MLGGTQNELPDGVFEQILAAAVELDSDLANESLIPVNDDPELTKDGHFINPEEARLFLDAAAGTEDDDKEEAEVEVEGDDGDHRDASNDGGDGGHDSDLNDLYSGDDNLGDDFGGVLP